MAHQKCITFAFETTHFEILWSVEKPLVSKIGAMHDHDSKALSLESDLKRPPMLLEPAAASITTFSAQKAKRYTGSFNHWKMLVTLSFFLPIVVLRTRLTFLHFLRLNDVSRIWTLAGAERQTMAVGNNAEQVHKSIVCPLSRQLKARISPWNADCFIISVSVSVWTIAHGSWWMMMRLYRPNCLIVEMLQFTEESAYLTKFHVFGMLNLFRLAYRLRACIIIQTINLRIVQLFQSLRRNSLRLLQRNLIHSPWQMAEKRARVYSPQHCRFFSSVLDERFFQTNYQRRLLLLSIKNVCKFFAMLLYLQKLVKYFMASTVRGLVEMPSVSFVDVLYVACSHLIIFRCNPWENETIALSLDVLLLSNTILCQTVTMQS